VASADPEARACGRVRKDFVQHLPAPSKKFNP
jgi:hypothetical protein